MRRVHYALASFALGATCSGKVLAVEDLPILPGEALYLQRCAACHAEGIAHPGWVALKANGRPEPLLEKRPEFNATALKALVRSGVGRMPALTPTYVTDLELEAIARFIGVGK